MGHHRGYPKVWRPAKAVPKALTPKPAIPATGALTARLKVPVELPSTQTLLSDLAAYRMQPFPAWPPMAETTLAAEPPVMTRKTRRT